MYEVKCRQCRMVILNSTDWNKLVVNSHKLPLGETSEECSIALNQNYVFLNEDSVPSWILEKIQEANWSKGRINCNNCGARIGSFNFISGTQCQCYDYVLPPVHLIKSKLDILKV